MKQEGTLAVGGNAGSHLPISTRPYGSEYARTVERNVAANEGVRALRRAETDALEGRGTKPKGPPSARHRTSGGKSANGPIFKITDPAVIAAMVREYESGESAKAVAARYGIHADTCRELLRRAGATLRANGFRRKGIDPAVVRQMVVDYNAGASLKGLAEAHRLSRNTVAALLRGRGVRIRPRGQNNRYKP